MDNKIVPYNTFSTTYMLAGSDLFSGGENDPVIDASVNARDFLAFDANGNKLPFSLQVGLVAQDINRDLELLEDKPKTYRRWDQKVEITIIVFRNMDDYMFFESSDTSYGELKLT